MGRDRTQLLRAQAWYEKALAAGAEDASRDLYKLLDREVATAENYGAYTPALKKLGGTWDRERLDRFLRDPQAMAPGTSMVFPGIADDRLRAAMVEYVIATSKVGGQ